MIGQFIIADILKKLGANKRTIITIEAIVMILLYILLLKIFFRIFQSPLIFICQAALILVALFIRIKYLKKYLKDMN